ncbi:hypothetical protein BKA64DRAFT_749024 [Cadophora sp. MPI-SDFR-AT-0126]|nr:hypothetical protein BKA64DRAFT_749024 [Leotiomycetes sp. MPI-SDFR-AT-0126]
MDKRSSESAASCLSLNGNGFIEFELSEFSIYLPHNKFQPFSMRGLQHLGIRSNNMRYLFDGILSLGTTRHYVQAIPLKVLSIGNFGEDLHEVGSHTWIQSEMNTDTDVFYRLGRPSAEYARFHHEFLWLADFAKHFVDYLQASEDPVSLHRFRKDFYQWLKNIHSTSPAFRKWYKRYNKEDFRSAVSVNIAFLFSESLGINPELKSHPIWREVMSQDIIPLQEIEEQKTIVTEYVYECFKDLRFGRHLKVLSSASFPSTRGYSSMNSADSIQMNSQQRVLDISLSEKVPLRSRPVTTTVRTVTDPSISPSIAQSTLTQDIKVGDVLSVTKDGSQSVWKDEISRWKEADDCWYVFVQKVHSLRDHAPTYDVLWLYRPSDTSCAKMKYPHPKELFMSDNCTCLRTRIAADEVLAIVPVRWYGQPSKSDQSHFIRQTYLENERFVTLQEQHKTCEHLRGQPNMAPSKLEPLYPIGSTVLVPPRCKSKHELEPFEIDGYITDGVKQIAVLRRLLRREEVDKSGAKNELVYTDEFEKVPAHKVQRACLVRFYSQSDVRNQTIPAPYNRKGNGNAFYITTRLVEKHGMKSLIAVGSAIPGSLIQGFNPLDPPTRSVLNGLDLFCGGGNFGRGLEEGGAVRNRWAVDIDKNAIHTYNANVHESDPTKLFYGSVNDMLTQAMKGNPKDSDLVPLPGEVDFISAGSPCQGFSNLNNEPNNEKGLKNQSLIASVAAYIDFYRPKYGILENVLSMAKSGRGRDEDVMSQLICSIVGLGYQVQLSVLDAWSFGSPQSRGRLFLTFAVPGLKPIEYPELSHSHPPNALCRGLGKLANGQAFGVRRSGLTPFEWVNLEECMSDLPALGDGATYQCIPFPDHVMAGTLTEQLRGRIEAIPIQPRGMNFFKAWNEGRGPMSAEERQRFPPMYKEDGTMRALYKPQSRAYTRVDPKGIFPCMTVAVSPGDIIMGSGIHWDDQRMFTAMEGRRIQGAPEDEVFLGSPSDVWKILGNSVNRNVSLALGLSLRDAWFANDPTVYRANVRSKADVPELNKSRGISLASRPSSTAKQKTIRRSTGRGVCAKNTAPSPGHAVDSSDDESGLTEWTCNFMMSLDLMPFMDLESAPEPTVKTATTSSSVYKAKLQKRPHAAIQEISSMQDEKSKKSPRASKISSAGWTTHCVSAKESHETYEQNTSNRTTALNKLQQVAREGLGQAEPGYIPDPESDGGADSEIEVISASVISRIPSRNSWKRKRHRTKLPSRPMRKQSPLYISLVSDDDDGDVTFQHQCRSHASIAMQQQRQEPYSTATPPPQFARSQIDRVQGSSNQRQYLPDVRPFQAHHTANLQSSSGPSPGRHSITHASNYSNSTIRDNQFPPSATHLSDTALSETYHDKDDQSHPNHVARHEVMPDKDIENREQKGNEADSRDEEGGRSEIMPREVATVVRTPTYVPVDNGNFMAYFQTSRYMGQRSGRAR